MERRYLPLTGAKLAVRAEGDAENANRVIEGYAAVYYDGTPATEYELWERCVERIAPGAFERALREDDVRCLFNHDPNHLLGRTSAKTLRLSSDATGLKFVCDPPATRTGDDVKASIERGDLSGCSFGFYATKVTWTETPDLDIRTIEEVVLLDVGPVTYPAYTSTKVGLRSAGAQGAAAEARDEFDKLQSTRRAALEAELRERDARARELRAKLTGEKIA